MAGQMIYFYYKNTNMMSHPNTIYEKKTRSGRDLPPSLTLS
jgi:hypothetical protein